MEMKQNFNLPAGKSLVVLSGNTGIEIIGEDIDAPYLDCPGFPASGQAELSLAEITEEENRVAISSTPECEMRRVDSLRIHLPRKGEGEISATTSNGRIELQNLSGRLNVQSTNGKIRITELKGALTVTSANGSLEALNLDGSLEASAANGRITVRDSRLVGGSLKSGNGRIALQIRPAPSGVLSIFSGNGRVKLALPDDASCRLQIRTKDRIFNRLVNYAVSTDQDSTIIEKGQAGFSILIQNLRGGVALVKYEDFDKRWEGEGCGMGFDEDFDASELFQRLFAGCDPGRVVHDFSNEIPHIAQRMARMGARFGRMGEEFSRQFHEAQKQEGKDNEVRMVLEMLKESKISAEEAEKLINALKGRRA